jgi:murein peptide amidase A
VLNRPGSLWSRAPTRLVALVLLATSCASESPVAAPSSTVVPVATAPPVAATDAPTTSASSTLPTTPTTSSSTTTSTVPQVIDRDVLTDISMTSVPADVIVPTSGASLDKVSNPINGRRGASRPLSDDLDCATGATGTCLASTLDMLGFDVTTGSTDHRQRSVERATAVVQLDAGLPKTGLPDDRLLEYMGIAFDTAPADRADEVRQIGESAKGRPITAMRFGDGPRIVMVVGQTHGDEEGGLRVLQRVFSLDVPDGITLWVIPTMNPDGLDADTRFLASGADPNRRAVSQPEQQAVYDFAIDIRPSLTVWYHQNYGWVGGSGASTAPARKYQSLTKLGTLKHSGNCAKGFMWCPIDEALGSSSILVELPDVLTPADVQIHADALLEVASSITL